MIDTLTCATGCKIRLKTDHTKTGVIVRMRAFSVKSIIYTLDATPTVRRGLFGTEIDIYECYDCIH